MACGVVGLGAQAVLPRGGWGHVAQDLSGDDLSVGRRSWFRVYAVLAGSFIGGTCEGRLDGHCRTRKGCAGATASLRPVAGGMELKSTFAVATAAANVDGAAYMSVDGPQFPLISGRHVTVELDATADVASDDQAAELQYVQNGLGQSGWKSFPVKPGRQTYRFAYAAPTDERTPSKVDTFWVRSDAAGRGRALIVHAVRLYIE